MIIAPSKVSQAGIRPAVRARLKRSQAARPCEARQRCADESSMISSASVGQIDRAADLDDHVDLGDRQGEEEEQDDGHGRRLRNPVHYDCHMVTEEDVYEALEEVIDPELGLDFVSLGLVYEVEIEAGGVRHLHPHHPPCPIGPRVSEQMREFVGDLEGVGQVHPRMVFDPPWSPEMMTEDAKFALGY